MRCKLPNRLSHGVIGVRVLPFQEDCTVMRSLALIALPMLLLTTTLSAKPGDARARFEIFMKELRPILELEQTPEAIADRLAKGNSRLALFRLESLCRLYEDDFADVMSKWRDRTKSFEDILGKYVDSINNVKFATQVKADRRAIAWLEEKRKEAREKLVAYMIHKDNKWIRPEGGKTALTKFGEDLDGLDFDTMIDDRKYLRHQLDWQLGKLVDEEWDLRDLDGGLHKYRRQIRWFLLNVQSLAGMVVLDDACPVAEYAGLMDHPLATSPYVRIPGKEPHPLKIPKCLFIALTQLSEEFGEMKDLREASEVWLPEALLESESESSLTKAREKAEELIKLHPKYRKDYRSYQYRLYARTRAENLVPILRAYLRTERIRCQALVKMAKKSS